VEFLLFGFAINPLAMIVIMIIALLIFGEKLPEVARGLGKGLMEFKKGLKGIEEELDRPLPALPPPPPQSQGQYGYPHQPTTAMGEVSPGSAASPPPAPEYSPTQEAPESHHQPMD
jgi:TatA/E family protein of Tat protein translocase